MLTSSRSPLQRYSVAVLSVALALGLTSILQAAIQPVISPLFFAAVMFSAWYGGLGPGLLATILAVVVSNYFFMPPLYTLALDQGADWIQLLTFSLVTILVSRLNTKIRLAQAQLHRNLTELQTSEAQYRRIVETAHEGIWVLNSDWQTEYVNPQLADLFGYRPADMLGRPFQDFVENESRSQFEASMQQGTRSRFDFCFRHQDGSDLWAIVSTSPIVDAAGQPRGILAMLTDIRDRKRMEEMIWQSEILAQQRLAELENIYRSAPVGLCFVDPQLRFVRINEQMAAMNGKSIAEHIGHTLEEVSPTLAAAVSPLCQQVMEKREPLLDLELHGSTATNPDVERDWLASYYPILDESHRLIGISAVVQDITIQKQAATVLRENEQQLRIALETGKLGSWQLDLEQRQVKASPLCCTHLGLAPTPSFAYDRWFESIHPEDRDRIRQVFDRTLATPGDVEAEYRTLWPDQSLHWLVVRSRYVNDTDDQPHHLIGVTLDITTQKQNEQHLRYLAEVGRVLALSLNYDATLRRLTQLMVPHLADWCSIELVQTDGSLQRGAVVHADPAKASLVRQLQQYAPKYASNHPTIKVLQTGKPALLSIVPNSLLIDATQTAEHLEIVRSLGIRSAMIVPLTARQQILGIMTFVMAESHRRYQAADLEMAEELARRAALAIDNARLYRDAQQFAQRTVKLQEVTAALSEALTPAQVADVVMHQGVAALGASAGSVVLLAENDMVLQLVASVGYPQASLEQWFSFPVMAPLPLAEAVRNEEPVFISNLDQLIQSYPHLSAAISKSKHQAFAAIPLTVEGQTLGSMGLSFAEIQSFDEGDRTFMLTLGRQCAQAIARAQRYEAEQQARAEAEAANRIKDEFLAIVSHELRSPLNPILGWAKLLRMGKLDAEKTDQALETIERNAKLQSELIGDLLDLSRILRGKLSLTVRPIGLVAIIEAAIETVRLAAIAKSIAIETHLDPAVSSVAGDPNRLQQIVWNLMSNAVKFTPPHGRIEVRLETVDDQVQIRVSDTGIGIDPAFLPHIFEYFRQADSTTTRSAGGLGLGLAIVRHLVELHGGTVHAASAGLGQGATFVVQFPSTAGDLPTHRHRPQPDITIHLHQSRILVVDDDDDARDLVQVILEQQGATVTTAESAPVALSHLNQAPFDLLISDIGMPQMNGYTLVKQLRASTLPINRDIPAIALTAFAGEYDQQQAYQAGFQVHLSKPLEPVILLDTLVRLLNLPQLPPQPPDEPTT